MSIKKHREKEKVFFYNFPRFHFIFPRRGGGEINYFMGNINPFRNPT